MGAVLSYFEALCDAMAMLAEHPKTVFIGQGVACAGTTMTDTLCKVPKQKLIEFPVAENLQMGVAIGMSLEGWLPICIYPRWNFLLLAADQLVNHLDRLPFMGYRPKVIIRTAVPVTHPFNPGPQHDDDFTSAFIRMLRTVECCSLETAESIQMKYERAFAGDKSCLLVEHTALYGDVMPTGVGR
jgi:pyruvate/2-oxoglutarate/acetoin dehydrogenase E1 component